MWPLLWGRQCPEEMQRGLRLKRDLEGHQGGKGWEETLERELAKTYAYEDAWQASGPAKGVEQEGGMGRKEVADGSLGRWTEQGRAELCACSGRWRSPR